MIKGLDSICSATSKAMYEKKNILVLRSYPGYDTDHRRHSHCHTKRRLGCLCMTVTNTCFPMTQLTCNSTWLLRDRSIFKAVGRICPQQKRGFNAILVSWIHTVWTCHLYWHLSWGSLHLVDVEESVWFVSVCYLRPAMLKNPGYL